MNVASLNNTDVSSVFALAIAPSSLAPRPASPASYPYGSLADVVDPLFKTVTLCTYALLSEFQLLAATKA